MAREELIAMGPLAYRNSVTTMRSVRSVSESFLPIAAEDKEHVIFS